MGTQLILTVGTNPLPVWVAWHHLKDKLPQPVQVRFVRTTGTEAEEERLKRHCEGATFLSSILTSAGDPKVIRRDIKEAMSNDPTNPVNTLTNLHIHYTGGTQAMGVETVAALEATLRNNRAVQIDASYLDPGRTSAPTIRSRNGVLVGDTRKKVDARLKTIALLNGFTIGPFEHTYWQRSASHKKECPGPATPDQAQLTAGRQALFQDRCKNPLWLEYGAYAAFEEALQRISEENESRRNCELFHTVYVRRAGEGNQEVKPFELDVVAVLGYQIVVVSCTTDFCQNTIKEKGMEAILRARQLGGDEARAIVLCANYDPKAIERVEAELQDETGSEKLPLQVWGKKKWKQLSRHFGRYLRRDLYWK